MSMIKFEAMMYFKCQQKFVAATRHRMSTTRQDATAHLKMLATMSDAVMHLNVVQRRQRGAARRREGARSDVNELKRQAQVLVDEDDDG
jgi:hypothetical protein